MKAHSLVTLALLAMPGLATADPPVRAPDFSPSPPSRGVDRSTAASASNAQIEPADDVVFDRDSAVLLPEAEETIAQAAHWLVQHPKEHLVVVAHTDRNGADAYNDELSLRRGRNVRDFITSSGVASDRVIVVACGARGASDRPNPLDRRVILYASAVAEQDTAARCK